MIGSLRGTVLERNDDGTALLEVGGVGYVVSVTPRTLAELEPGSPAFLHVHHHIREDAQTLYGFLHRDERTTFAVLIATHGIGPALALAILGTHGPNALVDIVASNDLGALTLVPGVGKKTAERLLVELRTGSAFPCSTPCRPGPAADRRWSAMCARRSPAWATAPTRFVTRCAKCLNRATRPCCCATR